MGERSGMGAWMRVVWGWGGGFVSCGWQQNKVACANVHETLFTNIVIYSSVSPSLPSSLSSSPQPSTPINQLLHSSTSHPIKPSIGGGNVEGAQNKNCTTKLTQTLDRVLIHLTQEAPSKYSTACI